MYVAYNTHGWFPNGHDAQYVSLQPVVVQGPHQRVPLIIIGHSDPDFLHVRVIVVYQVIQNQIVDVAVIAY